MNELAVWHRDGGVMVCSYEKFINLVEKRNDFRRALVAPGPDLLVCDEGHRFKKFSSKTTIAFDQIRTRRRIILTGTPMQNNLYEC